MSKLPMTHTLGAAREHYVPNGKGQSVDCGDFVAVMLRPLDLVAVCHLTDDLFGVPPGTHAARYAHLQRWDGELNVGAIRMNCGNRIRAAFRKLSVPNV